MPKWVRDVLATTLLFALMTKGYAENVQIWGHSVQFWFDQRIPGAADISPSNDAFQELGTNALPFLIGVLDQKPSVLEESADQLRSKYSSQRFDREQNPLPRFSSFGLKVLSVVGSAKEINMRRTHAAWLISDLGTNAAPAIPTLIKVWHEATNEWDLENGTSAALLALGDKVSDHWPDFFETAKRTNSICRHTAITLLGHSGPKAQAAVPLLLDLTKNRDPFFKVPAAVALWKVARQTNVALQVLTGLLTNSKTRLSGLVGLVEMGEGARGAIPNLITCLTDTNQYISQNAEALIRMIDPAVLVPIKAKEKANFKANASQNITKLIGDLQSTSHSKRIAALRALRSYGADAEAAVPALIGIFARANNFHEEPGIARSRPQPVVPAYGSPPVPILPVIESNDSSSLNAECEAAEAVLSQIGPAATPAVPELIATHLKRKFSPISLNYTFEQIGPSAREALPTLKQDLTNKWDWVRLSAAKAIIKIAPDKASVVVPVLHELQQLPLVPVYSPDAKVMTPVAWKPNPDSNYCRAAAKVSLWKLGLENAPPISEIVDGMENRRYGSESAEVWLMLLSSIGPDAKAALPAIEKHLVPFDEWKSPAALAIRSIDPKEADRLSLP